MHHILANPLNEFIDETLFLKPAITDFFVGDFWSFYMLKHLEREVGKYSLKPSFVAIPLHLSLVPSLTQRLSG